MKLVKMCRGRHSRRPPSRGARCRRIVLCFASFACAVIVMKDNNSDALWGVLGVVLLILTSLTDYFDGLVARKLDVISRIGPLADQMMDKMVYCIIFPTLSVGLMQKDGQDHIFHVMLFLAFDMHRSGPLRALHHHHHVVRPPHHLQRTSCSLSSI